MGFDINTFYEQITQYGVKRKDSRYGCMEIFEMQDGTRVYVYKTYDKKHIVKVELIAKDK